MLFLYFIQHTICSVAMEPLAFESNVRSIINDPRLKNKVYSLCTDGHLSIPKKIRELQPSDADLQETYGETFGSILPPTKQSLKLCHTLDPWHTIKRLKKKLLALSKVKDCEIISDWIKSIIYHAYHSLQYAKGDPEYATELFLSMLHHVRGFHSWEWESGKQLTGCLHGPISDEEERLKPWIKDGSTAFDKLSELVQNKRWIKDFQKSILFDQTSEIESFNSKIRYISFSRYILLFIRCLVQRCCISGNYYQNVTLMENFVLSR